MSKWKRQFCLSVRGDKVSVRKLPDPSPSPGGREKYFMCDSAACRYVTLTFATLLNSTALPCLTLSSYMSLSVQSPAIPSVTCQDRDT